MNQRKIKVVYLVNFDLGLKIHLRNFLRYQQHQGYDVSVICHPGSWLTHDTHIDDDIFVKIIPFYPSIDPWGDLQTLLRLVHYFRRGQFDIVHTSTVKPGLLGRLAAKIARVPIVVHTVRGLYLHDQMSPAQYRFFVLLEKVAAACCDLVLSQNQADIQTALRHRICPPHKISHLGNGIDLAQFDPDRISPAQVAALRAELGLPPGQPVVGTVARLVREKGIYEFLEAAHRLKAQGVQAKYLVVGSAQKEKASAISPQDLVRHYGLADEVMFLGHRPDIPLLLSLMDIVVLASYAEGLPRILMESASLAKPVVASRVRGTVEVVAPGQTGLLVPVRDSAALAAAILSLLQDPARAAAMGRRARQRALAHFDERLYFRKTDLAYRRLLKTKLAIEPEEILKPVPPAGGQQLLPQTEEPELWP